jgi:hypothetical protein
LHDLGDVTPKWKTQILKIYGVDSFERVELPDGTDKK